MFRPFYNGERNDYCIGNENFYFKIVVVFFLEILIIFVVCFDKLGYMEIFYDKLQIYKKKCF